MTDNSFCIKVRKDVISILKKLEIFQENAFSPEDHYADSVKEVVSIQPLFWRFER